MLLRKGASILRQPEDPKDDNTGGDGGAKPIPEEEIGRIANAAAMSQLKRILPGLLPDAVKGALESMNFAGQIEETVKKLIPQPPADGGEGGDKNKGSKTGSDVETKLQKQLEAIATELENEKKARQAAEQARLETETQRKRDAALSAFRSGVAAKVKPELQDVFVEHFGNRRLKVDDDGNPLLTVRRAPYKGAPEEDADVPLSEALPLFLASKEVQPFLPAPGGQQGGPTRPGVPRVPGSAQSDPTLEKIAALGIDVSSLVD